MWQFLNKLNRESSYDQQFYFQVCTSKRISMRYLHTHVYSGIIHNIQEAKQVKCLLVDEQTKCGLYTEWIIIYLKKETLTHATVCMTMQDVTLTLTEISQSQNNKDCLRPQRQGSQSDADRRQNGGCSGVGRGSRSIESRVWSFSFAR